MQNTLPPGSSANQRKAIDCLERLVVVNVITLILFDSPTVSAAAAASPSSAKTYVVCVRLANTESKPLSKHNLQVLSLSIPELHRRIAGRPKPIAFHRAYVHWEALSKDAPVRPISTPRPSSSRLHGLIQYELPPRAARAREGLNINTPSPTPSPKKVPAPSTSSSCLKAQTQPSSDWLQCDGSFIPDVSIKEWSVVSYQSEEFTRCISPLAYTDDAGDIAGRCNVTDYTEYGQLVFSVDVDFLLGKTGTGSHDAGN